MKAQRMIPQAFFIAEAASTLPVPATSNDGAAVPTLAGSGEFRPTDLLLLFSADGDTSVTGPVKVHSFDGTRWYVHTEHSGNIDADLGLELPITWNAGERIAVSSAGVTGTTGEVTIEVIPLASR